MESSPTKNTKQASRFAIIIPIILLIIIGLAVLAYFYFHTTNALTPIHKPTAPVVPVAFKPAEPTGIQIVPLHNTSATNLVTTLHSLLPESQGQNPTLTIISDQHTNSILLRGTHEQRTHVRALITQLDMPASATAHGDTQVIYLHYLRAKDLVPVLTNIVTGISPPPGSTTGSLNNSPFAAPGPPTSPSATSTDNSTNLPGVSTVINSGDYKNIHIAAEPYTNAIVVNAPQEVMQNLQLIISQLDVRPAQVLVEAIIVEINESKLKQLGVLWGTQPGSSVGVTPTNDNFSNLTGGLGIGFVNRGNMRVLISALKTDTETNILATPSLVVLDNQKAAIQVGQKVPFTVATYNSNNPMSTPSTTSSQPITTSDREDVALHLNITPQINQGNTVQLIIDQGNETLTDKTVANGDFITNTATITTTVMVNSGETLVLGGLINSDLEATKRAVPILSRLPLIGHAFINNNQTIDKKNLMVFIRPTILYDSVDDKNVTKDKYHYIRAQQLLRRQLRPDAPPEFNPVIMRMPDTMVKLPAPVIRSEPRV